MFEVIRPLLSLDPWVVDLPLLNKIILMADIIDPDAESGDPSAKERFRTFRGTMLPSLDRSIELIVL